MVHTIIIDDEKPAIAKMQHLLSDYPEYQVDAAYTSVQAFLDALDTLQLQVVFLDIAMPGMTGMELAGILKERYNDAVRIIFVTAYDEYAVDAFGLYAVDYLLKPIKKERFRQTIERLNGLFPCGLSEMSDKPVMIRSFGKLEITGVKDPEAAWRTAKVRELFALFLHHYPEGIYRSTLLEMLWSDLPAEKALANLNTCNYYLRKFLEQTGAPVRLIHEKKYYRLDLGGAVWDAQIFAEAEEKAASISRQNVADIMAAAELCRGKYFEDVNCTWANLTRDQYDTRYANLRVRIAEYYAGNKETEESIAQCILAIDRDALCDKAWQQLLHNYKDVNDTVRYRKTMENRELAFKGGTEIHPGYS